MPIKKVARYSRNMCQANPDWLFIFGDNMIGVGNGGQATIRPEPNAFGIPTKRFPSNGRREDFFYDTDFDEISPVITEKFKQVEKNLKNNRTVVWPADGIGTGLARLPETSPKLFQFIENHIAKLIAKYGEV